MADFIKTSPNVSFQYPRGGIPLGEYGETRFQSIGAATAFAEAIGVSVRPSFGYGGEGQGVECLHSPVVHGGDTPNKLHFRPTTLWDGRP